MINSDSASVGHLFARMGASNCLSFLKSLSGGRRCQFWLPAWTRDRLEMRDGVCATEPYGSCQV